MSMLSYESLRPTWPPQGVAPPASVVLGEGERRIIATFPTVSDDTVERLALLIEERINGIEYLLQRHYIPEAPEYFALDAEPRIPITLTITRVSEPPFVFYEED